jgi:hypothetical protein
LILTAVFTLDAVCAALDALFRECKLRNEAPIGQAALKVMQAPGEVLALYYGLPSSVSQPGCGEIRLLDYGQTSCFTSGTQYPGAHTETRLLFGRPGQRKDRDWAAPPPEISLHEQRPPGFSTRATSRPSHSFAVMITTES